MTTIKTARDKDIFILGVFVGVLWGSLISVCYSEISTLTPSGLKILLIVILAFLTYVITKMAIRGEFGIDTESIKRSF